MKLYKYRGINKFTLINLVLGTNYYPSARELNDPCDAQMMITKPTEKIEINSLALSLLEKGLVPGTTLDRDRHAGDFEGLFHPLADKEIEDFCSRGIYSLTEVSDQHLMWSHYGDSHKGICIEYEVNPSDYSFFAPVKYTDSHQPVTLNEILSNPTEAAMSHYFTKTTAWKYEREWRLLTIQGGMLGSNFLNITGIIVGARTPDIDALAISALATSPHITLYKAEIDESTKAVRLSAVNVKEFATACAKRCGIAA